jgi:hypothetical protein
LGKTDVGQVTKGTIFGVASQAAAVAAAVAELGTMTMADAAHTAEIPRADMEVVRRYFQVTGLGPELRSRELRSPRAQRSASRAAEVLLWCSARSTRSARSGTRRGRPEG